MHLGYFYENETLRRIEHRPLQELNIRNEACKVIFTQRLRVEERFFEPVSSDHAEPFNYFNWRFRYKIMIDIPLFSFSPDNPDYRLSLGVGDEIFINAGKRIIHNQFDQNWFLISPTAHLGGDLNVAVTWSNQYSSTATPGRFIHAQVIWLQVRQQFDLRKSGPAK